MRICSGAGCMANVADTARYCLECDNSGSYHNVARQQATDSTDKHRYGHLYGGTRWHRGIESLVLRRHPICTRCLKALSVIADHVVPAEEAIRQCIESGRFRLDPYAGFFLLSNLTGLCRPCHGYKTVEDKAHVGDWPSVVERREGEDYGGDRGVKC